MEAKTLDVESLGSSLKGEGHGIVWSMFWNFFLRVRDDLYFQPVRFLVRGGAATPRRPNRSPIRLPSPIEYQNVV